MGIPGVRWGHWNRVTWAPNILMTWGVTAPFLQVRGSSFSGEMGCDAWIPESGLALDAVTPSSADKVSLSPLGFKFVTPACSPLGTRASMVPDTWETLDKYLPNG